MSWGTGRSTSDLEAGLEADLEAWHFPAEAGGVAAIAGRQRHGWFCAPGPSSQLARALALFWFAGSVLSVLPLILPAPGRRAAITTSLLLTAGGLVGAATLAKWGGLLRARTYGALLAASSVGVAAHLWVSRGADAGAASAVSYVWIAMYAFHFFRTRVAIAQLGFAGLSYGAALALAHSPAGVGQWIVVMGVAATVGTAVSTFSRRLVDLAATDSLTGLPNRQGLDRLLEREVARSERSGEPLSVAMIDLDHFKKVNDTLGHLVGDDLLVTVTKAWRQSLRAADGLARFGGDEFVVVLPGADERAAVEVLDRMAAASPQPCSVGVASWRMGECARDLLGRADSAVYLAKKAGRNRLHVIGVTEAVAKGA